MTVTLKDQFEKSLLQFKQKVRVSLLRRFKYSMLFKSLARPQIQYCSTLWFMADNNTINTVQVQMRTILKEKSDTPIR